MKTKAYSYLRISTDAQRVGDGVRRQIESGEKYAEDHGYDLVETLSDLGVSGFKGKNAKKGALSKFLAALDSGKIASGSVLIVESLDRLSRDGATKAFTQFAGILSYGITIVTLMDGQTYTEDSLNENAGQLFTSLGIMIRANEESATKSIRIKAAWAKKRQDIKSKKLTKCIPAWLELDETRTEFIVREKAARTIETIFDFCIKGMGVYAIARQMNGDLAQYPTIAKAQRWYSSYVSKILHSPAVYGKFQPHEKVEGKRIPVGEVIHDYYPAIVIEDRFVIAQKCLSSRKIKSAGRKGKTFSNLFTNLVECGNCGGSLIFRNKGKPPKGGKYLKCQNVILNSGCKNTAWRYSEFEESFYKFVQEVSFADVFNEEGNASQKTNLENQKVGNCPCCF